MKSDEAFPTPATPPLENLEGIAGRLEVDYCAIEKLIPYARNPRKNDSAVDRMARSIQEYGFAVPMLARRDGEVIDGHLRLKGAQKRGLREVPVIWCDSWTPAQVKAFRLLVNRSATWAEWDEELLAEELTDIGELGMDLAFTGFDVREIDEILFRPEPATEADDVIPLLLTPVTRLGDRWRCGDHFLLCGDATSEADVGRLLGSAVPVLMVTDPPYGVEYEPEWRERAGLGVQRQTGKVANDDCADWTAAYRLFPGDVIFAWHASVHAVEVAQGLVAAGFELRAQIIWAKQNFALSRGPYHWQHEPCWFAVRRKRPSHWCGDRSQSTLWEIPNLNPFGGSGEEATGHGTQKPVELMKRPILNHTERGEAVYDPFLGSGTTLVAAELVQRRCYAIEIEPKYVDVALMRWQRISGAKAIRTQDEKSFDQLRAERDIEVDAEVDASRGDKE